MMLQQQTIGQKHLASPRRPHRRLPAAPWRPSIAPPHSRHLTRTAVLPGSLDQLVLDSTLGVSKIGVVCAAGASSAKFGMLNEEARRALSKLAINVFTPAVMITKLGAHTDLASALSLWPIGAKVIICHFVGLGLGMLHTRLLPTPQNLKHIILVSSSITNTGNLPLVLVLSLIKSPNLPFNTAAQAELAVSYIMLGWWYATLVQMPLGTLLLHKPKAQQQAGDTPAAAAGSAVAAAVSQNNVAGLAGSSRVAGQRGVPAVAQQLQLQVQAVGGAPGLVILERPTMTTPASLLSLEMLMHSSTAAKHLQLGDGSIWPRDSNSNNSSGQSHHSEQPPVVLQPQQQQQQQQQGPLQLLQQQCGGCWEQHAEVAGPLLRGVLSPPLLAGIVAILIGSCPPLQEALFSPRGSLSLVGDVLDMLGQPLTPVLLLVLGANLSNGPQLASGAHLPAANVAGVIATKLLLSPVLGLCLILAAQKAGIIGAATDPLEVLVMMVAWSTPTAVLVHSLALVHRNGEDEVSALLFYECVAAALTLPLCSTVYLYMLGCCAPQVA